ncbi:MAG: phospholipase D-like domain-containing protein [Deltaproteobacteria bacterium]|nr:phospholipase D-like domain-containing protein [Deltaproteobacteria bacterium]
MNVPWAPILLVAEIVWVIGISVYVVLERRSPTATLAWIVLLGALPLLGAPIYLFVGPRRLERKKFRLGLARKRIGSILSLWKKAKADLLSMQGQLMRVGAHLSSLPPEVAHDVKLFLDGDSCYDALVEAISGARHHVHLEYFIFRDDQTGQRIVNALVERAKAGLRVRLLVDSVGARLRRPAMRRMREAGVEVRIFNGVRIFRLWRRLMNFRTHRKIVVIDGIIGFTGGMNVTDHHSFRACGKAAWRDTHVKMAGPAVHGLQATFLENWVFTTGDDLGCKQADQFALYFPPTPPGSELSDIAAFAQNTDEATNTSAKTTQTTQIVASGPDGNTYAIEAFYFAAITSAHERLWLTTPYFVPGEAILAAIASAAERGVDVRLLLPRRTDSALVDAAGRTFHDQLLDAGARIYLYEPAMLHAKTAVVDNALAIVGTANLDNRSFRLNFEVIAAFYGGSCVTDLARAFEADLAHATLQKRHEAKSPFVPRLVASFARLLAPQL